MEKMPKIPATGDKYRSVQYGRRCKVICVFEGRVKFQWLGRYAYIDEQTATIQDFVTDFRFIKTKPKMKT